MTASPDRVYTVAETLLECAFDQLADVPLGQPPRACVIAGGLAWDDCECGQLTLAIERVWPSQNFPTPASNTAAQFGVGRCGHPILVAQYTVTMLRCVPSGDENGNPPSCTALATSALNAVLDAEAVRSGLLCCLQTLLREKNVDGSPVITGFSAGEQIFVGPDGFCGGSAMTVQVGFLGACPCGG